MDPYDVHEVETRWQARWDEDGHGEVDLDAIDHAAKFYNLVEFPYPSAEGLHVGHVYTYCGADTFGRYMRMRGKQVFQPMGFDSFGIHTENYALRVGENPKTLTARTVANYRRQLRRLGAAWAWSSEIVTRDPSYYRWTQWVFLQLYRAGLAVRTEAPVVWCPSCLTVLAFEQLEGDRCERCRTPVTRRVMKQWFLRITAYADHLLDGLDSLDWPAAAVRLQRDWIGRSRGVEVDFAVKGKDLNLPTFTTRPDTLFGVTFLAVPPEHSLLPLLVEPDRRAEVEAFTEALASLSGERGRDGAARGAFTGSFAVHAVTGAEVPIFVADYVVADYGTGAVMGVPAHDPHDHAFAEAMGIRSLPVIRPAEPVDGCWTGPGTLVESGRFTGMASAEGGEAITGWLEEHGLGRRDTRYRLHDWLISRQRYWGPPIPIVHCERCGEVPVPEEDLPVLLPDVEEFRPTGTSVSPLAAVESFVVGGRHREQPGQKR